VLCTACKSSLARKEQVLEIPPPCSRKDWEEYFARRRKASLGALRFASICYVLAITATTVVPGLIFNLALPLYAASAALVATGLCMHWLNHLTAALVQAVLSVAILVLVSRMHPGVIYMLVIHTILAMIAGIWIDGLHDTC
jgi:hypothetical protein